MLEDPWADEQSQRRTITPTAILISALVAFCLGAALFASKAMAESYSIIAPDGDFVRLHSAPCEVASGWMKMKKAQMKYQGKLFDACWFEFKGQVIIVDSEMDASSIPVQAFKKDEQV